MARMTAYADSVTAKSVTGGRSPKFWSASSAREGAFFAPACSMAGVMGASSDAPVLQTRYCEPCGIRHPFRFAAAGGGSQVSLETTAMSQDSSVRAPALLPSDAVEIVGDRIIASSLVVAKLFRKRHDHVLRDIDHLDCSPGFRAPNFGETFQNIPCPNNATRRERYFELTKDGFVFLVMGYRGAKAASLKEAYIRRFNEMESRLCQPSLPSAEAIIADKLRFGRFLVHTNPVTGQLVFSEIDPRAFVLPAKEWPSVIRTPDFPRELLPAVLEAVGERMKES